MSSYENITECGTLMIKVKTETAMYYIYIYIQYNIYLSGSVNNDYCFDF